MFSFFISSSMILIIISILITITSHLIIINFLKIYGEKKGPIIASTFIGILFWFSMIQTYPKENINNYWSSVFLYVAFIVCYIEFFFLINRGYSLNLLSEISNNQEISKKELANIYGGGKGLKWMFEKRIDNLINLNLIKVKSNKVFLKKHLILVSILFYCTKFFGIKKSGL